MKHSAQSSGSNWLRPAREAVLCATSQPKLNSLEQSDREEAIECWLNSHKVADAWDLAPALVHARVDEADLETVKRTVPAQDLENALHWLAANLTTRDLLKSISHSTERISELVRAVKSYSFMDQAPWQEIARGHRKYPDHPRPQAQERDDHARL